MSTRLRNLIWLTWAIFSIFCLGVTWDHVQHLSATEVTGVTTTTLLNAQTANGTAGAVIGPGYMPRCRESAIYIVWGASTNGGQITIETAHDPNFSGTWAPLLVKSWAAASSQDVVQITGIHAAIRTRITSAITGGGSVSTFALCN